MSYSPTYSYSLTSLTHFTHSIKHSLNQVTHVTHSCSHWRTHSLDMLTLLLSLAHSLDVLTLSLTHSLNWLTHSLPTHLFTQSSTHCTHLLAHVPCRSTAGVLFLSLWVARFAMWSARRAYWWAGEPSVRDRSAEGRGPNAEVRDFTILVSASFFCTPQHFDRVLRCLEGRIRDYQVVEWLIWVNMVPESARRFYKGLFSRHRKSRGLFWN